MKIENLDNFVDVNYCMKIKNKMLKKRITDFKDYRFRKILIKVNNDYMCNEKINYSTYIESLKVIDKYVNNFIIY